MANKKEKNKEKSKLFTVDAEGSEIQEVPTISILLKRKKLTPKNETKTVTSLTKSDQIKDEISTPESHSEEAPPPPRAPERAPDPIEIAISEEPSRLVEIQRSESAPSSQALSVRVQPAQRKNESRHGEKLILWDTLSLSQSQDPLAQGLSELLKNKVDRSLFLCVVAAPPGSPVPHFVASAAVAPRKKTRIWRGLRWDPTVVPDLWNVFVRDGLVELAPPGPHTRVNSDRNVVRGAFGTEKEEWLTLVRVGPSSNCRGILAVFSAESLLEPIRAATRWISKDVTKKAA